MELSWIKSPTGRRVVEQWADPRPTWLWAADGSTLLWRNIAARGFPGRSRKRAARLGTAVPIRGQVARLIRLGSLNRASLSRMQFLAGERPVSATCACTPLALPDGQTALFVIDVDPIAGGLPDAPGAPDTTLEALLLRGMEYLLFRDGGIAGGSAHALGAYAAAVEQGGLPEFDAEQSGRLSVLGTSVAVTRFKAGPDDASLLLFEPASTAATGATPAPQEPPAPAEAQAAEPLLPLGLPPLEPRPPAPADEVVEERPLAPIAGGLTSLFDRLMDDGALFTPLSPDEEFSPPPLAVSRESAPIALDDVPGERSQASTERHESPAGEPGPTPATTSAADEAREFSAPLPIGESPVETGIPAEPVATAADDQAATLYRVVGRGFSPADVTAADSLATPAGSEEAVAADHPADASPIDEPAPEQPGLHTQPAKPQAAAATSSEPPAAADDTADAESLSAEPSGTPDAEAVERVSRYNFDELSRILNDRVGNVGGGDGDSARVSTLATRQAAAVPSATPEGALVTLGGETLVLNRLPLGILVFRDQQVLFANRAITEMTGYDSVEGLRNAGLSAIFPSAGDEAQQAGPVNHLVQRDGALVPVTARLQSVSWQGRPALMLSASMTEVRTGHEAAVRAFAEHLAASRADGFIETARSGVLTHVSGDARLILRRDEAQLLGRPVSTIAAPGEIPALRDFLERPARFAETARPAITVKGVDAGIEIMLFAQGQAGVISGYFGFVRRAEAAGVPALAGPAGESDPALLARLSRGVRRPLNTVIGFSDLIGSAAFGEIENRRYLEYARDIKTAGLEIAALVDELDDFARLRDGRYAARPTDIDLAVLLESSVMRVRAQANAARVLVRSAISESLPRVRADRASLAQAILNLLASAIDQTPQDGSVVLSAQLDDFGGVTVNVRDSAHHFADLGERFVVFRDGVGRDGEVLTPVRSSVGLALTRALLAVNQATLSVDPAAGAGMLFSLAIPSASVLPARQLPGPTA